MYAIITDPSSRLIHTLHWLYAGLITAASCRSLGAALHHHQQVGLTWRSVGVVSKPSKETEHGSPQWAG